MRINFTFIFILCTWVGYTQVADFEEYNLDAESYLNESNDNGGFMNDVLLLPNSYNANYDSWTGWAISNTTDTTTPGFMNQYSAITGGGAEGSVHYAVTYDFGNNNLVLRGDAAGQPLTGMYVTNSTFAYLSMRDGDAFAKKFGGLTGDDSDFFVLTIGGFYNGNVTENEVEVYLADYRFEDNNLDYILDEWQYVDLTALGPVDSLSFMLNSSDIGNYGMNTPAYFCIDQVFAANPSSVGDLPQQGLVDLYPNPVMIEIQIQQNFDTDLDYTIVNSQGQIVQTGDLMNNRINVNHLVHGIYMLHLRGEDIFAVEKFMKQ